VLSTWMSTEALAETDGSTPAPLGHLLVPSLDVALLQAF
jgi:hypothetical protein